MNLMRSAVLGLAGLLLAACASVPGMPETTYYRLPPPSPTTPLVEAPVGVPIVVEILSADGLYADQALIYTLDADASRLRTYHYQLWIDPPARLLQRRLIENLRLAGVSRVVTDQLPTRMDALRIVGRITRLERVHGAGGWDAVAALALRAEPSSGGRPWVIGEYQHRVAADGDTMADTVRALAQAIDRIGADFIADLVERAREGEAGHDAIRIRHVEAD